MNMSRVKCIYHGLAWGLALVFLSYQEKPAYGNMSILARLKKNTPQWWHIDAVDEANANRYMWEKTFIVNLKP